MKKHKPIQVGDVFPTNEGGSGVVVEYRGAYDVIVRHADSHGHLSKVAASQLRDGRVKNPYKPRISGVGFVGVGPHSTSKNGKDTPAYKTWTKMLERAYCEKKQLTNPTYIGCSVAREWHCFQNFAEWYESQPFKGKGYQLDKDILVKGNKIYAPDRCRFVPEYLNKILCSNEAKRGVLPMGVAYKAGRYYSKLSKNRKIFCISGGFETPEEAHEAYKKEREGHIRDSANNYRNMITEDIYLALMSYSI